MLSLIYLFNFVLTRCCAIFARATKINQFNFFHKTDGKKKSWTKWRRNVRIIQGTIGSQHRALTQKTTKKKWWAKFFYTHLWQDWKKYFIRAHRVQLQILMRGSYGLKHERESERQKEYVEPNVTQKHQPTDAHKIRKPNQSGLCAVRWYKVPFTEWVSRDDRRPTNRG